MTLAKLMLKGMEPSGQTEVRTLTFCFVLLPLEQMHAMKTKRHKVRITFMAISFVKE